MIHEVILQRGHHEDRLVVSGDIHAWLTDHQAKPTKDPSRFTVHGWRCLVNPVAHETAEAVARIIPGGAMAKALATT